MKKILLLLITLLIILSGCGSKTVEEPEPEPVGYSKPIYVLTMKDSDINSAEDLIGKRVGVQTEYDHEKSDYVIDELVKIGYNAEDVVGIGSYQSIPDAIKADEIDAWIVTEEVKDLIGDYRNDYVVDDYKVVATYQIPYYEETTLKESITSNDLYNKPFVVMLNGLDERVDPDNNKAARNDVNLLLVVDPVNKHYLTISFPRDSWLYVPSFHRSCKMTEIGVYGGNESIREAVGYLFDIEIENFVQVSFSSFIDMITSLGGVWVDVPLTMEMNMNSYRSEAIKVGMDKGYTKLYGEWALALARNRKYNGIYNGDYGRIRNQCLLVNSIIKKIANNPTILDWAGWGWLAPYLAYYNFDTEQMETLFALAAEFSEGYTYDNYFIDNVGGMVGDSSVGFVQDYSVAIAKGKIELIMTGKVDEDNPYYDEIMEGYHSFGTGTYEDGYLGETYDLNTVYPQNNENN